VFYTGKVMMLNEVFKRIENHTLLDFERIASLWRLAHYINDCGIRGDFVECGSYKGGSSAVLRIGMGPQRKLWIYDSFEGMPETSESDGEEAKKYEGTCVASLEDVLEILYATGAKKEEFIIVEGLFENTFQKTLPEKVSLLHCDADWYKSVTLVLETFYPLMPQGGCIILDDFGFWEGCRRAFYDFCQKQGERPLLERVGITQAFWIKAKEHNRNG
jgi:O-methyltransferase